MYYNVDLRFTAPPLLSLFLLMSNSSNENCFQLPAGIANDDFFFFLALIFLLIVTLFFLVTSFKIPLNVSLDIFPFCLKFGDFSGPLALSLLASLLLPPPLFCIAYFICICISPWFTLIVNILEQFWQWVYQLLQSIPTFTITPLHETIEAEPPSSFLLVEADPAHSETELA